MRPSNRTASQIRPVTITRSFTCHAEGSVLIEFGNTKVLCNASVQEGVPNTACCLELLTPVQTEKQLAVNKAAVRLKFSV